MSWNEDTIIPKGHQMSMNEALHIVSTGTFIRLLLPDWILNLTKRLKSIRVAFEELQVYKIFNTFSLFLNSLFIIYCLYRCICLK